MAPPVPPSCSSSCSDSRHQVLALVFQLRRYESIVIHQAPLRPQLHRRAPVQPRLLRVGRVIHGIVITLAVTVEATQGRLELLLERRGGRRRRRQYRRILAVVVDAVVLVHRYRWRRRRRRMERRVFEKRGVIIVSGKWGARKNRRGGFNVFLEPRILRNGSKVSGVFSSFHFLYFYYKKNL